MKLLPVLTFGTAALAAFYIIGSLAPRGTAAVRQSALITSLLTLLGAGYLAAVFPGDGAPFAVWDAAWLGGSVGVDIRLSVGLDGLSIWL